jgi:hypothetical protein
MRDFAKEKMSARERLELTLQNKESDRVPINDFIQNFNVIEYCTGQKVTKENYSELACKVLSENVDCCETVPSVINEGIRKEKDGFVYKDEWWTSWIIEKPFSDTKGLKEHILRNINDLNVYNPGDEFNYAGWLNLWGTEAPRTGNFEHPKDRFKKMQEMLGDVVMFMTQSPIGLDIAYNRAGWELFSYAYVEYPELIHKWLQAIADFEVKRIHDIADYSLSPLVLSYCDIAWNNGLIFSPDFLRKELIPFVKQNVDAWHSHGIKVFYHSEGDVRAIIPDLIEAGVDGIHPVEPMAGMSTKEIKEKFPGLLMIGGLDNSQMLNRWSMDEIDNAVKEALLGGKKSGGYIISSSEIHPACDPERVVKMWDSEIRYGWY